MTVGFFFLWASCAEQYCLSPQTQTCSTWCHNRKQHLCLGLPVLRMSWRLFTEAWSFCGFWQVQKAPFDVTHGWVMFPLVHLYQMPFHSEQFGKLIDHYISSVFFDSQLTTDEWSWFSLVFFFLSLKENLLFLKCQGHCLDLFEVILMGVKKEIFDSIKNLI